jgi:hypothetical protein
MVNNYDRGKIYKIICNISGKIYIGSTTEPTLSRRLAGHKGHYNYYLKGKYHYITSFEVLKNGNYYIELICNAACTSKDELNAIEGKYIRELKCVNKFIPGRTKKEYQEDNAEKIKKYRDINADKIKQYKIENEDKIKQYTIQYNKDNAEKFKQQNVCNCGGKYSYTHKSMHLKTKKHQKYLNL